MSKIPLLSRSVVMILVLWSMGHDAAKSNEVETPQGRFRLAASELERIAGPEMEKMERTRIGRSFLRELMASKERMADLMLSGPLDDPAKSLRILAAIWKADPKGVADRHEQTTAAAVALMFAREHWPEDRAVDRYEYFRDSRLAGKLHPQFDALDTWEKRFVVAAGHNGGWGGGGWGDEALVWLRDNVKLPAEDYLGACWQAPYKGTNVFGDSIHGPRYYAPFAFMNFARSVREVGGVCGSLSHYGANAARANGLPATTMGEPAHCAYAVRVARGEWMPAYSLSWQRGVHTSLWGGSWTQLVLQERVLGERASYVNCMTNVWQARASRPKNPEAAEQAYRDALAAQPLHYPVWCEFVEFLRDVRKPDAEVWDATGRAVATALAAYPEVAWDVLSRIDDEVFEALSPEGRMEFYLRFHERIAAQESSEMWEYEQALDDQAKALGVDRAQELAYFEKVLVTQSASKSWFAPTIAWGQRRFASDDSSSDGYFAALGRAFSSAGSDSSREGVKHAIRPAILAAEEAGNVEAFQSLGKAGSTLIDSPPQEAKGFPGELLSSGGLLRISSSCQYDHPENHWGVLEEDVGGSFHTGRQKRPYAVVRLGKLGDLSGIVVLGSDYGQNGGRQMPLKVSVSEDGATWQEVFRTTEQQGPWRIPLKGKASRVLYVKAERDDDREEFFHLAGIRVYGRRLQ